MAQARLFIYVVDRDFGFAPNPFHGVCTLATCKPRLRNSANIGDWVAGVGGSRLKATGQCIFAMRVGKKMSFNQYWNDPEFFDKRPVRNGTNRMLVGDNIYHTNPDDNTWIQEDSHHSMMDGSVNISNLTRDTSVDAILVSDRFFYFGKSAPAIPSRLLTSLGYKNARGYRVFNMEPDGKQFIAWIEDTFPEAINVVTDDPFEFDISHARYSAQSNKVNT